MNGAEAQGWDPITRIVVALVVAVALFGVWNWYYNARVDRCYRMAEGSRQAQLEVGYEAAMDWTKLNECFSVLPPRPPFGS